MESLNKKNVALMAGIHAYFSSSTYFISLNEMRSLDIKL